MTANSITKLCVAGVLLSTSSHAAGPEGAATANRRLAPATAAQIEALENYSLVSLKRIQFSAGHSNPTLTEKATLDQIAKAVAVPNAVIELRGYADGAATPAANIALSMERANTIARLLTALGVARGRILILGLGEADSTGPPRLAEHQRVDVRVFVPSTAGISARHDSAAGSFIQDTWGGK